MKENKWILERIDFKLILFICTFAFLALILEMTVPNVVNNDNQNYTKVENIYNEYKTVSSSEITNVVDHSDDNVCCSKYPKTNLYVCYKSDPNKCEGIKDWSILNSSH